MFVLFVLLFVALIPTGSKQWSAFLQKDPEYSDTSATGVQAACFWQTSYWHGWYWDGAMTDILLLKNYVTRAGALFEASEARFHGYFHERPLKFLETPLFRVANSLRQQNLQRRRVSYLLKMHYRTLLCIYCITLALLDIYRSFFGPLLWALLNLVWGTIQTLTPRNILPASTLAGEKSFGSVNHSSVPSARPNQFFQANDCQIRADCPTAVTGVTACGGFRGLLWSVGHEDCMTVQCALQIEAEEQSGSTSRVPSPAPQQQA